MGRSERGGGESGEMAMTKWRIAHNVTFILLLFAAPEVAIWILL